MHDSLGLATAGNTEQILEFTEFGLLAHVLQLVWQCFCWKSERRTCTTFAGREDGRY